MSTAEAVPPCEIIYVADPMCSWCWGFAPVIASLASAFVDKAPLRVILGGLRPGERAEPLDDRLKQTIRPHWERVAELTGQPFDFDWFDREDFLFDTEPASRAVVFARRAAPDRQLAALEGVQRAFYADGIDVTQADALARVLDGLGYDGAAFREQFDRAELGHATRADFTMAGRLGAQGFPTVLLRNQDQLGMLTAGYQPLENLLPAAERFLA